MPKKVSYVPPEVLDVVGDDAMALLEPAIDMSEGRWSVDEVAKRILTSEYQLWMVFDEDSLPIAALVTKIENYPHKSMLNLLFTGGEDLEDWHDEMLTELEKFSKDHGCHGMELVGRFGWKKFLASHGWETNYVVCERTFVQEMKEVA
jgi:hypothetical protein